MKFEYDKEVDAAYIYLQHPIKDGEVKNTIELNDNIVLDFNSKKELVGLQIMNASKLIKDITNESKNAIEKYVAIAKCPLIAICIHSPAGSKSDNNCWRSVVNKPEYGDQCALVLPDMLFKKR